MGAGVLRQLGIGSGARVGLMSENRPEWGLSYFAIVLSGAACVPLDKELRRSPRSRTCCARLARAGTCHCRSKSPKGSPAKRTPRRSDGRRFDQLVAAHTALAEKLGIRVMSFDELLAEPDVSVGAVRPEVKGDTLASLIFTSGNDRHAESGDAVAQELPTSMVSKLSSLFTLYKHDTLLSVLPLHHTFEFSAGFLMPLLHGACSHLLHRDDRCRHAAPTRSSTRASPAWSACPSAVASCSSARSTRTSAKAGALVEKAFESIVELNRSLRDKLPWDIAAGKLLFFPVHKKLGGRMRLLISGGSALPADTMKAFRGLGFNLYEGRCRHDREQPGAHGHAAGRQRDSRLGWPRARSGTDVRIDNPDGNGVGEAVAKGPNVMTGYFENADATAATIQGGWLHTGDLGRLDADGNLYIVGRKKEMILGPSGENVYPDELEELYGDSPAVKEISVVGLPGENNLETVAVLIAAHDYEHGDRDSVREQVRDHVKKVSKSLPMYKRLKIVHLWDHDSAEDVDAQKFAARRDQRAAELRAQRRRAARS